MEVDFDFFKLCTFLNYSLFCAYLNKICPVGFALAWSPHNIDNNMHAKPTDIKPPLVVHGSVILKMDFPLKT